MNWRNPLRNAQIKRANSGGRLTFMVINREDIIFGACPDVVAIVAELDLASSAPLSMPIDISMLAL